MTDPNDKERGYLTTEFYIVPGHRHQEDLPLPIFSDQDDSGSIILSSESAGVLGQIFGGCDIQEKGVGEG